MAFMLSPLLKRYTEQHMAVLRADFYRAMRHNSAATVAGRCQADHPAHAGHGRCRTYRSGRSSRRPTAQFNHHTGVLFYCLSLR